MGSLRWYREKKLRSLFELNRPPTPFYANFSHIELNNMSDISKEDLRKEIDGILEGADLDTLSSKKVRQQLEEKLKFDLADRKKEIDELVMEAVENKPQKDDDAEKPKIADDSGDENDE